MEHTGKWWREDHQGMRYISESGKLSYFLTGTNHTHLRKQDLQASIINFIQSNGRFPINPNPIYGNLRFTVGPDVTQDMLNEAFFISTPLKMDFNFGMIAKSPAAPPTGATHGVPPAAHGVPPPGKEVPVHAKKFPAKEIPFGGETPRTSSMTPAPSPSADTQ